jgi:hypothetical protein
MVNSRHLLCTVVVLVGSPLPASAQGLRGKVAVAVQRIRSATTNLAGRVTDQVVRLRGPEKMLARAEQHYERGEPLRALSLLRSTLLSKRTNDLERSRTLLYIGTIQSQLGNHLQAARAFAGLAQLQPDFQPPADTHPDVVANIRWGQQIQRAGLVRGELLSADVVPARPSLLDRARSAAEALKIKAQDKIASSPRLLAAYAQTVGRVNVWRARRAIYKYNNMERFPITLEPDPKNNGSGFASIDGKVHVDYSTTLTYPRALEAVAHEVYHLQSAVRLPQKQVESMVKATEKLNKAYNRIFDLRQLGASLDKSTPDGQAKRSRVAKQLITARRGVKKANERWTRLRVKEERAASEFAAQVLVWENQPLTSTIYGQANAIDDGLHPPPKQGAKQMIKAATRALEESSGLRGAPAQ